jgi:thymidine phosphorylase
VLDVKCGSGAFMKTHQEARALATALVETSNAAGCPTTAVISDMNQPLVPSALATRWRSSEVMRALTGTATGPLDLMLHHSGAGGRWRWRSGGLAETMRSTGEVDAAQPSRDRAGRRTVFGRDGGRAWAGRSDFVEDWRDRLPAAKVMVTSMPKCRRGMSPPSITAHALGEAVGLAVIALGGGRQVETDKVDPAVGLSDVLPLGTAVSPDTPLLRIHAARGGQADEAEAMLRRAITIGPAPAPLPPLIHERLG